MLKEKEKRIKRKSIKIKKGNEEIRFTFVVPRLQFEKQIFLQ